jgi:hypothetical protein
MASPFEVLTECVREQLADDTIAWGIFRIEDSRKDAPRRVVWIPTDFHCEPVLQANPLRDSETGELGDSLLTDRLMVECNITGLDFEDGCLIRTKILNACRNALGISSHPIDGAYVTEQQGHSGYLWGGAVKIVQRFEWLINVPKADSYFARVDEIDQTSELITTDELLVITPP